MKDRQQWIKHLSYGRRLRKLRLEADLEQKDVADAIGLSRSTYNQIENQSHALQLHRAVQLKVFYAKKGIYITLDYLITGEITVNTQTLKEKISYLETELKDKKLIIKLAGL